jgi:hypothetical protein
MVSELAHEHLIDRASFQVLFSGSGKYEEQSGKNSGRRFAASLYQTYDEIRSNLHVYVLLSLLHHAGVSLERSQSFETR